jgi:lipopolysaccharide heptosyltransferase II
MNRILIVLVAGIGDLVLASKAVRAIRNGFPDAEIHILTSTDSVPIALNYDFITRVWPFPVRELRKSRRYLLDMMKTIITLRKTNFDEIMNLYRVSSWTGAIKMGLLFLLLKGKSRIGHAAHGFGFFLTKTIPPDTFMNRHFAEAMLEIAVSAGGIPDEKGIEIFWDQSSENKWKLLLNRETPDHILVGINPGGDRENRRWDSRRYAAVADRLAERFDSTVFIFGGPGEEDIARQVSSNMKHDAVDLSGKLSLDDLAYMISRLDLLVTNDSGPMHIGAATGTPLVALFGPEDPSLMGPYTRPELYRILYKDVSCRPCIHHRCERFNCLDLITPEDVLNKCIEILEIHKPGRFKK